MGIKFKIQTTAAPEKAFEYVSDVSRHGEWANPKSSLSVQPVSGGTPALGAKYRSEQKFLNKDAGANIEIVEFQPPSRVKIAAAQPQGKKVVTYTHDFTFTPSGSGTVIQREIDSNAGVGQKIMGMLALPAIRADAMAGLRRLKEKLDS